MDNSKKEIFINFPCGGRDVRLSLHTIVRFSRRGSQTIIYSSTGEFSTHRSLLEITRELPPTGFVRIHRAHIVASQAIHAIEKHHVVLQDGTSLPVTYYYKQRFGTSGT